MPRPTPTPRRRRTPIRTRANSDRHTLYQLAVQSPDSEIEFLDRVYRRLRGRRPTRLREDFCGTAHNSCEWVKLRTTNSAVGVDLHRPTLDWGVRHNLALLAREQRSRVRLLRRDVRDPGPKGRGADVVLALNFSYWVFKTRDELRGYFASARRSLAPRGLFVLDIMGGWETMKVMEERRREKGFWYVWNQAKFNPITHDITCHIEFDFKRGPRWRRAFTYHWRLWTLPEVRELLDEAGFTRSTVYWEGDDGKGGGNGVFRPQTRGEDCASFIAYIVAEP